ncbi:MAG: tol-pal system protein YbgF [Methylococcaceae bacterium]|nr:tol-pal system protein YbgF [Methylococcaceae bacterium]
MKLRIVFLLSLCNVACAELPPVVGGNGNVSPNQPVIVPKAPASTATYETMKRLEQMQAEVQQLTGKVEEQAFQIEELKKQQKTMYTDFDDRLQTIENKSDSTPPAAATDSSTPSSSTTSDSEPPPPVDNEQVKPEVKSEPAPVSRSSLGDSSATGAVVSETSSASSSVEVSDVEKQDYQQAYDDLRNGKTAQSITEFNAYLTSHPTSGYASNAQYWLGEAHRVNLDNTSARSAFNQVVDKYPNSAKVPDALYKLGIIELEEKNQDKAREIFTKITTEFANSKAASLAQKKLQTLDAAPH